MTTTTERPAGDHIETQVEDPDAASTSVSTSPSTPAVATAPATEPVKVLDPQHVAQRIDVLRNQIDAVDDALIRLIDERVSLSKNVGALRRSGGGPRLSLNRENQILGKFSRALGASGTPLAMLLLKICRGRM